MKSNFKLTKNNTFKDIDQSDHVIKLYINSFMKDNFFNLQNIFLIIWET